MKDDPSSQPRRRPARRATASTAPPLADESRSSAPAYLTTGRLTLDARGFILQSDARAAGLLGIGEADLAGRDVGQCLPVAAREAWQAHLEAAGALPPGQALEWEIPQETGPPRYLLAQMVPASKDAAGAPAWWLLLTDLSQHRQAEERHREREELFRRTFDLSPIGAAMVGLDYRFLRVNQELCRLTGYSAEELTAMSFPDITYPEDLEADLRQAQAMLAGEIDHFQLEKRYLRKDGRIIWVRLSVRAVRDAQGRILYFLPMMEDIDQARRALNVIRRNEQDLGQKNKRLQELNTALQVLMEHRAREREDFGAKVMANLKALVLPYLEMLKSRPLAPEVRTLVEILGTNLGELTSPIAASFSQPAVNLTPMEIRVADLVRQGKASKEIAKLLDLTPRSVAFHRNNLRKKLGISSRKGNLRSALISLPSQLMTGNQ